MRLHEDRSWAVVGPWSVVRPNAECSSIAVVSRTFVEKMKALLGIRAKGREVIEDGEGYQLLGGPAHYGAVFEAEKDDIGIENTYLRDTKTE